jgi:shikimate kinase
MGAGKTSVGKALASRLGWRFLDLDDLIETGTGRKIADIFRESGEAAFRQAEAAALRQLLATTHSSPLVVALGGGAYVSEDNARQIKAAGAPVIFLDAPASELRRRCAPQGAQRPLFQDENLFHQLYAARRHAYMQADHRIDTAGLSIEEVATEVMQRLKLDVAGAERNV